MLMLHEVWQFGPQLTSAPDTTSAMFRADILAGTCYLTQGLRPPSCLRKAFAELLSK